MRVFLDPGHGGEDQGAIGSKTLEKDFNLEVAQILSILCHDLGGWDVMLSRETDVNVSERESARRANDFDAAYYVSLHANAAASTRATGTEVLFWHSSREGFALASEVQHKLLDYLHLKDRGLKPIEKGDRGWVVLGLTRMPAILLEPGFLTNPTDESVITSLHGKTRIALAVYQALQQRTDNERLD